MGVITLTKEVPCAVAPQKMFHAFCVDLHNMVPKAAPNGVKNIGVHSGAPGVGRTQLRPSGGSCPHSNSEKT
ncbi:Bet v I domain [Macleaya cordata]|uniref:Bet v I domain n=1 Tax=Macleaya cordata TaxID=56857 RepID=A0A200QM67_MACCD|nr:Bet v I domain [Macleaya cordata]